MSGLLLRTDRWLNWLDLGLAGLAALCIVAMMLLTGADVVMRYAFNSPIPWAYDLVIHYLLVASFFLGLSYTLRMNHHICVDFFARMLPSRSYQWSMALGSLAAALIFGVVAWYGLRDAIYAWTNDEVAFGALIWPMWASKAMIPLGMAPLALRCLHRAIAHAVLRSDRVAQSKLGLQLEQHSEVEV
ncbi:MAG: TRAP transporter small permease [Mesorhizobium sp.]